MSPRAKGTKATRASASPVPAELRLAKRAPDIASLPKRQCLAIDGTGSPKAAAFAQAISALYGAGYTLEFGRKQAKPAKPEKQDFKVGHLEGRWHIEVYLNDPSRTHPDKLKTVLLRELAG